VVKKRKVLSMSACKILEVNKFEDDPVVPNDKYLFRESFRAPSSSLITVTCSNHTMFGDPEIQR